MDARANRDFERALGAAAPPAHWPPPLAALWWAARGAAGSNAAGWDRAHALVQDEPGAEAAWVHAHLHRIEGDLANAAYWYRRAGRAEARGPLDGERAAIAAVLMSVQSAAGAEPPHDGRG